MSPLTRTTGPTWYTPVDPPSDLRGLLACAWTAEPSGRHRLVPDACIDILRLSSGPIMVCGPETRAWEFELPPGISAVGIRFRPGAAPAVLGFDASAFTNRVARLAEITGAATDDRLAARLGAHTTADAERDELVSWVRERAGSTLRNDAFAERVVRCLATSPRAGRHEIADVVGLSVRQLHRRSLHSFGYGTATLGRLLRFQDFVAATQCASVPTSLGALAADAGYTDQAHLAHDCRSITGLTTSQYLASYFPTFPDMSDPYKIDARSTANMPT